MTAFLSSVAAGAQDWYKKMLADMHFDFVDRRCGDGLWWGPHLWASGALIRWGFDQGTHKLASNTWTADEK
jgi:hypothetical protein